jgi:hypothetical protein
MAMRFQLRWRNLWWALPWFINLSVMWWIDVQPGWQNWPRWFLVPLRIAMSSLFVVLPFVSIGGLFGRMKLGLGIGLFVLVMIFVVIFGLTMVAGPPP